VYAWTYDSAAAAASSTNYTVVANMSDTDKTTRTLLMSRKQPGTLLVSRGTVDDEDKAARTLKSGHAQLRAFDVSSSQQQHDFLDGLVLGWGLRNSVGLAEHPAQGGIWSVENSIDELTRNGQDIHADNPAEELNYHGRLNDTAARGANYGFPLCYALWNTTGFPDLDGLKTADQFPGPDAQTFTDATCNKDYVPPRLAFQAHSAPLDIKFDKDGSRAFIAFHGSCKLSILCPRCTSEWAQSDNMKYKSLERTQSVTASRLWHSTLPKASRRLKSLPQTPPSIFSPPQTWPSVPTRVSVPSVSHGMPRVVCGSAPTAQARSLFSIKTGRRAATGAALDRGRPWLTRPRPWPSFWLPLWLVCFWRRWPASHGNLAL
jgi:hypothetical protein